MKKKELIHEVWKNQQHNMPYGFVESVVSDTFEAIKKELSHGGKVTLTDFGTFEVRQYGERKAHNPRTGEQIIVAAKKMPAFRAGKRFKEKINR